MTRSPLLGQVLRAIRLADACEKKGISAAEAIGVEAERRARHLSRRQALAAMGRWTGGAAALSVLTPVERAFAGPRRANVSVGIVGAGLAGLTCADQLARAGIDATVYDAADRVGGRCYSLRGFFPGQVAERGGEFIDNAHKTMLRYARRFELEVEDVSKPGGDIAYYFNDAHVDEATVVDEFREFVSVMRADLRRLSSEITASNHTNADIALDQTSLLAYLHGANGSGVAANPVAREAIIQAYIAEYGLEADEQSCLNFLLFIHADRRSKFTPFGVFSDERWHIVDGNDRVAEHLAASLPTPVQHGKTLVRVAKTSGGSIELTFDGGGSPVVHDHVVLAIPFSVLRDVVLDPSLGISGNQQAAIDTLGYGNNAKLMLGFTSRPWISAGFNGTSYSDASLPNHQATWETNPVLATSSRAILTDYSGGDRGAGLNPGNVQGEAEDFLADLNHVFPGAVDAARRDGGGDLVAYLEHWPTNPLTRGSYTCYLPGQFTTVAGLEGLPVGALHFAGEHANSFYEWQGFMEGAALSGIQAAAEILQAVKKA